MAVYRLVLIAIFLRFLLCKNRRKSNLNLLVYLPLTFLCHLLLPFNSLLTAHRLILFKNNKTTPLHKEKQIAKAIGLYSTQKQSFTFQQNFHYRLSFFSVVKVFPFGSESFFDNYRKKNKQRKADST